MLASLLAAALFKDDPALFRSIITASAVKKDVAPVLCPLGGTARLHYGLA